MVSKLAGFLRMVQISNNIKALIIVFLTLSCTFLKAQDKVIIKVNLEKNYQTISNFGASDAWACQYIGLWPEIKREKIADLLFSRDTLKNGNPKGIGLSLWRFNIGAGSVKQGEQSNIADDWRRTESFLNADGTYDWTKQAGQMWFLEAARQRGVKQFLGFSNSPPVNFTINGRSNTDAGKTNIIAGNYKPYAEYLANVVNGIERISKVNIAYISPVNEPQWDWNSGQEGCPYTNTEIAGLARTIDTVFNARKIHSQIVVAEAGSLNYLIPGSDKPDKGNQINDFFNATSPNYIGDLHHLNKTILAHGYFTTSPAKSAIALRQRIADAVNKFAGLSFWQSEYCILGDNNGDINGNKRDLGMDAALYLASVIHTDLTSAKASAWQWWTAISPYNYKDGLIYVDKNKTDGNFYVSKMLWAFGNYSRFITPGAVRVEAKAEGGKSLQNKLLVTAFRQNKMLTITIINGNKMNVPLKIIPVGDHFKLLKRYTTSEISNLAAEDVTDTSNLLSIPERSVTTIICAVK